MVRLVSTKVHGYRSLRAVTAELPDVSGTPKVRRLFLFALDRKRSTSTGHPKMRLKTTVETRSSAVQTGAGRSLDSQAGSPQ